MVSGETGLLLMALAGSISAILFLLLGVEGLIALSIAALTASLLIFKGYRHFRTRGMIGLCSPRVRALLLQRSLLDILRDLIYFPYITKFIQLFITIATLKPHPDQVPALIKELSDQAGEMVNRKGLLSLTPSAVQALVLPENSRDMMPSDYGNSQEKWDRIEEYQRVQAPPHEATLEVRLVHFLDSRMGWVSAVTLLGLTLAGGHQMRFRRFRQMMINNATFCCLVLSVLAIAVKIRRQHLRHSGNVDRGQVAMKD